LSHTKVSGFSSRTACRVSRFVVPVLVAYSRDLPFNAYGPCILPLGFLGLPILEGPLISFGLSRDVNTVKKAVSGTFDGFRYETWGFPGTGNLERGLWAPEEGAGRDLTSWRVLNRRQGRESGLQIGESTGLKGPRGAQAAAFLVLYDCLDLCWGLNTLSRYLLLCAVVV